MPQKTQVGVKLEKCYPTYVSTQGNPENEEQAGDGARQGGPELIGLVLALN